MVEHYLQRIFAIFNRTPNKKTFEEYLNYLEDYDDEIITKLFYHVRDNHTMMPSIAQLRQDLKMIKGRLTWAAEKLTPSDCYFCQGIGLVPYLLSPKTDPRIARYTTAMQRCKCPIGEDLDKRIPLHTEVQFEKTAELSYPILVQVNMNKFNKRLNAMSKKG